MSFLLLSPLSPPPTPLIPALLSHLPTLLTCMGCACSRWPGPESRCRGQTGKGTVGLSRVKSSLCFSHLLLLLLPVIWHHSCPDPAGGGDCDLLTLAHFKGRQSYMADIIVTLTYCIFTFIFLSQSFIQPCKHSWVNKSSDKDLQ